MPGDAAPAPHAAIQFGVAAASRMIARSSSSPGAHARGRLGAGPVGSRAILTAAGGCCGFGSAWRSGAATVYLILRDRGSGGCRRPSMDAHVSHDDGRADRLNNLPRQEWGHSPIPTSAATSRALIVCIRFFRLVEPHVDRTQDLFGHFEESSCTMGREQLLALRRLAIVARRKACVNFARGSRRRHQRAVDLVRREGQSSASPASSQRHHVGVPKSQPPTAAPDRERVILTESRRRAARLRRRAQRPQRPGRAETRHPHRPRRAGEFPMLLRASPSQQTPSGRAAVVSSSS